MSSIDLARPSTVGSTYFKRQFSTSSPKQEKDSIFESADYFKEAETQEEGIVYNLPDNTPDFKMASELPYIDSNDTLSSFLSTIPKDVGNLSTGKPTYGFWEYVQYCDDLFYGLWISMADTYGLGLGAGLIASSFITKLAFAPPTIYSQTVGLKMKLLAPDMEEG